MRAQFRSLGKDEEEYRRRHVGETQQKTAAAESGTNEGRGGASRTFRRSPRLRGQVTAATATGPPKSEQDYFAAISLINSVAQSETWTGACDGGPSKRAQWRFGGLGKRALEVAYPPFPAGTRATKDSQARATAGGARVERLGAVSPSQARAARGRSPVSREEAAPEPGLGVVLSRAPEEEGIPFFPGSHAAQPEYHLRSATAAAAATRNALPKGAFKRMSAAAQRAASSHRRRSGGSRAPSR